MCAGVEGCVPTVLRHKRLTHGVAQHTASVRRHHHHLASLPLQASSRGYDRLPQFGAAGRHGLARGEQERLLMKLRVLGLLQDDTQRQEQHGSIVSVLSLHQVGPASGRLRRSLFRG